MNLTFTLIDRKFVEILIPAFNTNVIASTSVILAKVPLTCPPMNNNPNVIFDPVISVKNNGNIVIGSIRLYPRIPSDPFLELNTNIALK